MSFRFGDVREISAQDYVAEVNKAGDGVFVVLHLYKQGIPLCALINQYLTQLAAKFPTVKVSKYITIVRSYKAITFFTHQMKIKQRYSINLLF